MEKPPSRARRLARDAGRMLWCVAGAACALLLILYFVDPPHSPLLLASLGGSAVFLFGLTRAAAAQPRALLGGHLGGALVGICCYQAFGDAPWVYVLAVSITLVLLLLTRSVHPPAGANPIIMVHSHAAFGSLLHPIGSSVLLMAVVAAVWSRIGPAMARYPVRTMDPSPPTVFWGGWDD
ncbi:MAG TPA: HPP family protein [Usitatibacter sp.]|nr:HPP family protein [Usitatibacter sp.]